MGFLLQSCRPTFALTPAVSGSKRVGVLGGKHRSSKGMHESLVPPLSSTFQVWVCPVHAQGRRHSSSSACAPPPGWVGGFQKGNPSNYLFPSIFPVGFLHPPLFLRISLLILDHISSQSLSAFTTSCYSFVLFFPWVFSNHPSFFSWDLEVP